MQNCQTASAGNTPLVPNKRVNYAFGMVLGVDDFRQEQLNTQWKFQLDAHLPHGYGTLCGLQVTAETLPDKSDVQIRIGAGYAISPHGHWLWVPQELCALLNAWLSAHPAGLAAGQHSIYVRLCYTECLTDLVPIAANACASAADSSAPSRITEAAAADFSWKPPRQIAEERVREFGRLLSEVEIVSEVLSPDDSAFFLDQVRSLGALTSPSGSPVVSPALLSPPQGTIRLSAGIACATFQEALTIWATEVRPTLNGARDRCLPDAAEEDCLLLARIDFTMDALGLLQVQQPVTIVQDDRPILADTRLLQEWITCGPQSGTAAQGQSFATVTATNATTLEAWVHYPRPLTIPLGSVSVQVNGVNTAVTSIAPQLNDAFTIVLAVPMNVGERITVGFDTRLIFESANPSRTLWSVLETPGVHYTDRIGDILLVYDIYEPDGVQSHHDLLHLTDGDDHTQYLKVNPNLDPTKRSLLADLIAAGHNVTGLRAAAGNGEAVRFEQAVKVNDIPPPGTGDLGGKYPNPTVIALQGQPVSNTAPAAVGEVLTWSQAGAGQAWQAQPAIDINQIARTLPILPFATITPGREAGSFTAWFHVNAGLETGPNGGNNDELDTLSGTAVKVFVEIKAPGQASPFVTAITIASLVRSTQHRNVWTITLNNDLLTKANSPLLRFVFHLDQMKLKTGETLKQFVDKRPMLWEGSGGDATVTVFVQNGSLVVPA